MAYEMKELSGSIFVNDKREKDTHPNMKGSALIGGVEYWVSGWTKEGQKGKWMSLAFKPKDAKPDPKPVAQPAKDSPPPRTTVGGGGADDSDYPF